MAKADRRDTTGTITAIVSEKGNCLQPKPGFRDTPFV